MPSEKDAGTEAFVADASVGIAWSVASQATPAAIALLDRIGAGTIFVVPSLWPFEVVNALLTLVRRKRMTPADFARVRGDFWIAKPVIDDEGSRLAWSEVAGLAEKFGLTVYDAVYLELAIRKGLALALRDTALNNAARLCGVKTLL